MVSQIQLGKDTQDIIGQCSGFIPSILKDTSSVKTKELLEWMLQPQNIEKNERFLWERLQLSLFSDINGEKIKSQKKPKSTPSWASRLKIWALALAVIIYVGCEGYDGIASILGLFSLPLGIAIAIGAVFSVLWISVFFAFSFMELAKNLGVKIKNAPEIIDVYKNEIKTLYYLRKKIAARVQTNNVDELEEDILLLEVIKKKHEMLGEVRSNLQKTLNTGWLKNAKIITAAAIGILYRFSGGFFAGQAVAMIPALFAVPLVATSWPVILACTIVGLAALMVYWFDERPAIESALSRWLGFDEEKIQSICDIEKTAKENEKLEQLTGTLQSELQQKRHVPPITPVAQSTNITSLPAIPRSTNITSLSAMPRLRRSASLSDINTFFAFTEKEDTFGIVSPTSTASPST